MITRGFQQNLSVIMTFSKYGLVSNCTLSALAPISWGILQYCSPATGAVNPTLSSTLLIFI